MRQIQSDGSVQDVVSLSGSNAPLAATAPKLIATVNFSQLTASSTLNIAFPSVLNRNARQRTFIFYNSLNQPTSAAVNAIPYDSTIGFIAIGGDSTTIGTLGSPARVSIVSESHPSLAAHVDSIWMSIPMGATAPTSGSLQVYVVEF